MQEGRLSELALKYKPTGKLDNEVELSQKERGTDQFLEESSGVQG
jgi:hypothetical protein